jgi:uncharacterized membrane protein YdbT with pleckstrin-like domain
VAGSTYDYQPRASRAHDHDREYVIARIHPHLRLLIWPSFLVIAMATGYGLGFGLLDESWMRVALLILCLALIVVLWVAPVMFWLGNRMTITTRRVIIEQGMFARSRSEIALVRIHEVTARANVVQSLFRSGDVLIGTGAERDLVMRNVPRVALVQAALTELVERSAHAIGRQPRESARWK